MLAPVPRTFLLMAAALGIFSYPVEAAQSLTKTTSIAIINDDVSHATNDFAVSKGYTTSGIVVAIRADGTDRDAILSQHLGDPETIGRAYLATLVLRDPNGNERLSCAVGLSAHDPELRSLPPDTGATGNLYGDAWDTVTSRKQAAIKGLSVGSMVTVTGYDPRVGTDGISMYGCDLHPGRVGPATPRPHPGSVITATALEDQYLASRNIGNTADFYNAHYGKMIMIAGHFHSVSTNDVTGDGSQILTTISIDTQRPSPMGGGVTSFLDCDLVNASEAHGLHKGMKVVVQGTFDNQQDNIIPGMLSLKDCSIVSK